MASQVEGIKWIQGTRFMVDGFRFQNSRCQNYFLTHFHSDHTTGAGLLKPPAQSLLMSLKPSTIISLQAEIGTRTCLLILI